MRMRLRFAALLLALAATAGLVTGCNDDAKQRVLLISLDGFRWDYRSRMATPTLDAIAAAGVSAAKLEPAFPSKTFPNHFTLVTGLVPDHHGIISNNMRDPRIPGVVFTMGNRDAVVDPRWWEAEPIWTLLEKQGRRTAPLLWPGAEAPIGGVMADHWMKYEHDLTDEQRLALVAQLFEKPEADWPDFTTLYWHQIDTAGHRFGPDSPELREAVERIDGALGQLRDRLRTLGAPESLNVIVVSDHGMSQQASDRVIYLEDYIDLDAVETLDSSPSVGIYPVSLTVDQVYEQLAGRHPRLRVYRKGDYPERLQFGTHPRVPPIYAMADEDWAVYPRRRAGSGGPSGGAHGYDNAAESMQGLFVAAGPALKRGVAIERFRSVDVYELMCAILGVTPASNDGSRQAARALLR
ncbi:MAG TPA: ectonucleotide pyrophosphatase/phosphodiesterase [Vicinamibacterales bacterium]|nr:ectonucleotide pyrophosphatase/phosphodiesterase [Vicinamibacterales bacterium]